MNNSFLSPKVKRFPSGGQSDYVLKIIILLFLFSQTVRAQYHFDSFTTDNGLPQNGVRGIAQTPDGYLWFTTFDGLVRYDGERFAVFDKNNSKGILSNRFFVLQVAPDGTLLAGTEDGGLTVYRGGEFRTYTVTDGLPSNDITIIRSDARGETFISTTGGDVYFRNGKFVAVKDAENPNQGKFYLSPAGNLWLYAANGVKQIAPDGRETFYPIKIEAYNERFSGIELFEDSQGYLWFGDLNGVYRLKNGEMKKFGAEAGLPPRMSLRPMIEDADGSIWFASGLPWIRGVGVVHFKDGRFTTYGENFGLSSLFVNRMFRDREGTIWVSTDKGLNRLRRQFIESYSVGDNLIYSEVYPLLQTRNGDVFVGTTQGLSRFRDGKFSDAIVKNPKGDKISVTALAEDGRGRLWVGTLGDLFRWENERLEKIPEFDHVTIWAIHFDSRGDALIGTEKGLFIFRDDKFVARYTTDDGLPSNDVKTIHEDGRGTLWIGTYGGLVSIADCGLQQIADCQMKTFTTVDGLASDRVRSIYEDASGTLWIGTYDGGLSRFKDGRFFNYTIENGLFNNGVFQILEDERGNFWISCNKGIFRVSKQELNDFAEGRIAKINSVAYGRQDGMLNTECNGGRQPAGIKTSDGRFWFPTQNGVVVINPNEVSLNPNPPPVEIETVLIERQAADFQNGIEIAAGDDNLEIRYTGISFIKPEQVKFRYRVEGLEDDWTDVGTRREVYFPFFPAGEYTFHVIAANSDGVWNETGARLKIRVLAPFWRTTWFVVLCALAAIALVFSISRFRINQLKRRQLVQQEFSRRLLESQEQERKRIATEMHDSLGQYLLAIKNWALFGLNSLPSDNAAREYLDEVSETSSLALDEVREIAHNLRPYQLERLGLTNTLEYTLKNLKTPICFSSEIENIDGVLSNDAEIIFYRIVQECLNNVVKHSAAQNALLSVKRNDGLEFVCRDDGRGFDFETAKDSPESGLGLSGLAERVKILNGEYKIDSEIGKGTTVSVKIPKSR
ncbi:MAG: histidine kinase [Acidobacteriota bacterium]|nr:histidine kinase [Acidobacteriota bacterium]